jgi:hypothetical protein
VNLGENGPAKIITRSDLKASMQSYENVSLPSPHFSSPFSSPLASPCGLERTEMEKEKLMYLSSPFLSGSP